VAHAETMNHVWSLYYNPVEVVKANNYGTINAIDVVSDGNVKKIVALSTNKDVNPVNLMVEQSWQPANFCYDWRFMRENQFYGRSVFRARFGSYTGESWLQEYTE
jgi:hypothetical protein